MKAALSEGVVGEIHNWRNRARKKRKAREQEGEPDSPSTDSKDQSDHTIDIESPRTNGRHANYQRLNGESNGFHHLHSNTISSESFPPQGEQQYRSQKFKYINFYFNMTK